MASHRLCLRAALMSTLIICGLVYSAAADDSSTTIEAAGTHPLAWTFSYAKARSDYIQEHIRDYSCRLIKRERINGELQPHQFIEVSMRCEQRIDGDLVHPMAVFMQYLAPGTVKDRRVLYVEGQNDGKMLVRKGGRLLKYAKIEVDPNGSTARRESNYPITDVGFDKIIERLIEKVEEDIENDPAATNTLVSHFRNARVGDRVCTHIQVIHPQPAAGIKFHKASLYIDDQLQVPIRLVVYDWPPSPGQPPPLMEEYIYVNLKLNVGLSDADFSKSKLEAPDRSAAD